MPSSLMSSPTLARVTRGELCAGCGLCASVSAGAVRMEVVEPGYRRPAQVAPVDAAAERLIAECCPGSVVAGWGHQGRVHPYWGPWRDVLTAYATDPQIRFEGSSGGAISALLIQALRSGLVDRVVHVGASTEAPAQNATVVSRTPEEILARAGSRYAPSSPLEGIEAELAQGGAIAFVGKPCDVSALRRLATRDARVGQHVKLMISFFCGGIPSHAGAGRILKAMGVEPASVREFRFRGRGWPGDCVATTAQGAHQMSYAESWGGHLSKEVQFRCKICPDAVGGAADIACADAWYGDDDGYPSFEEQEGRSLVISRTETGAQFLAGALEAGLLAGDNLDIGEIDKMQPSQARRKRLILARTAALPLLLQPRPRMRGLKVLASALKAPPMEAMRNLVGTLRRTVLGRRSRL